MRILSKKVWTVKAGIPADEHMVMFLSGADHFVRPRHVPILLFYPASVSGKQVLPTEILFESLKKLLVHFPPLSGRLKRLANSSKFELVCCDAGAEFTEASVDGTLADFGDFQPNRLYTELLNPAPRDFGDVCQQPVMYAQVTRFACGSAAFVASSIHTVTDGLSVYQWMVAWSELARGLELSDPPFHDRRVLKSLTPPDPGYHPEVVREVGSITSEAPQLDLGEWPTERMFKFGPAQLQILKDRATSGDGARTVSSFQTIDAHIWRSITKARCLHPSANTKFLTTLDARTRVKPNLPKGYFGNAICFACATTTAGEIVKQPLSYAAGLIHDALSSFCDHDFRSVMAFVDHNTGPFAMNVNAGPDEGHDVSIASWARMQFHQLDFGSGKPLLAAPGNNPYDGSVIILSGQEGKGHLNVYVSLKREHMERLEADSDFVWES